VILTQNKVETPNKAKNLQQAPTILHVGNLTKACYLRGIKLNGQVKCDITMTNNLRKKPPTIREIAKLANVSYQTVSLVINNKPGVSSDTRQRLMRLMQEMDFRPNKAAQMLTTNRSQTLELITVDVHYGGRLADSTKRMAHTAKEAGYSLLVSETDEAGLAVALDNAAARMVDGVILYAPQLRLTDEELQTLSNGIPFVRRDYVPGAKYAWVGFDQVTATRMATEYLIELGHKQIAAVPPTTTLLNGYWRLTTWKNVLREHGLEPGPYMESDYSMQGAYEATLRVITSGQPFTALMIGTDNMALGVLRALREHGLRSPQDVSIISFDNAELATFTEPSLTTVEFKFTKQDEMAVRYLLELLANPTMEVHQRVLTPDLIVRESTRPV
jgi:LacI family transcriptional regulator